MNGNANDCHRSMHWRIARYLTGVAGLLAAPAIAQSEQVAQLQPAIEMGSTEAKTASEAEGKSFQDVEPAAAAQASGWQFIASPYMWLAGLKGDMGVSSEVEPVAVDLSFGTILKSLKFAAMGSFEARHGRFVASSDLLFMKLGTSKGITIRDTDFVDADLDVRTLISTFTVGYRAVDKNGLFMDVFAGGRLNSMKTGLDLVGPNRSFFGSKSETWVDPVVGVRFQAPIGSRWSLAAFGDVGGFGVGSHSTWQLGGVFQYHLSRRWTLFGGWRHLDTDYSHNGFVFDAAMDGPIMGAIYRF